MTIENYFERRIRPIVEDTKNDSNTNIEAYNHRSGTSNNNNSSSSIYKTQSHGHSHSHPHTNTSTASSIIDEDQLARTFQEIVNCINLDDDSDNEKPPTKSTGGITANSSNFSRSNFHHSHHSLLPEFNSIFGGTSASFNIAVGSGDGGKTSTSGSGSLGKSFLDDDWFPVKKDSVVGSAIPITTATSRSSTISNSNINRPMTPSSNASSSFNRNEYFLRDGNSYNNLPPSDYVCKLCNCDGHWMKDCRLYEPRTPPASISSFKSTSSSGSFSGNGNGNGSFSSIQGGNNRTLLPPGNYVCRLCNVAGHWIDQCSKFQPKNDINNSTGDNMLITTPVLPPMLGPGPTPNYRPPAYLSKPVPSNYICNLCNRPGHWIQQCTEFTPIINHKPQGISNNIKY